MSIYTSRISALILRSTCIFVLSTFACVLLQEAWAENSPKHLYINNQQTQTLSICRNGVAFCHGETPVVLMGVNIFTIFFAKSRWSLGELGHFIDELNLFRSWSANFVIIGFDPLRSTDVEYVNAVVKAAEYAKDQGMFVQLTQQHMSLDVNVTNINTRLAFEVPMVDLGAGEETNVSANWLHFLSHPGVGERLKKSVDIFGLFGEPALYSNIDEPLNAKKAGRLTWAMWRPRAERICKDIRQTIKRQAICSVSGINWGWDVTGMLSDPVRLPNIVVEVHQYKWHDDRKETWDSNAALLIGKYPILVGEFGHTDPPEYIRNLMTVMRRDGISWAAWPGPSRSWKDNYIKYKAPLVNLIADELKETARRGESVH